MHTWITGYHVRPSVVSFLRVSGTCKTGSDEEVVSAQRRLGEV